MPWAGRAWRGWFPVGGELTSGTPDRKEGIYFGAELGPDDPRVAAGIPLHGANLFPSYPPGLRATVLEVIDAFTRLGHQLMIGLRARARPRRGLVRPRAHPRPDRAVPDLPLPAVAARCSGGAGLGSGGAHGLRAAHDPGAGRDRRPRAEDARRVDLRAGPARRAGLQPRRHARADDRRPLPVHPAPGPQPASVRPDLLPVLLRPRLGRRGARRSSTATSSTTRPSAGTAPASSTSTAPTATTSSARSPRSSPTSRTKPSNSPPPARFGVTYRALTRATHTETSRGLRARAATTESRFHPSKLMPVVPTCRDGGHRASSARSPGTVGGGRKEEMRADVRSHSLAAVFHLPVDRTQCVERA